MKKYLWLIPGAIMLSFGIFTAIDDESIGVLLIVCGSLFLIISFAYIIYSNFNYIKENFDVVIKVIKGKVYINTKKYVIKYKSNTFRVEEILKYQLVKNEKILLSSGIGEAIIGGILFGGSGALAGAYAGKKEKYKEKCVLYIETNNPLYAGITIPVREESGFKICKTFDLMLKK